MLASCCLLSAFLDRPARCFFVGLLPKSVRFCSLCCFLLGFVVSAPLEL